MMPIKKDLTNILKDYGRLPIMTPKEGLKLIKMHEKLALAFVKE